MSYTRAKHLGRAIRAIGLTKILEIEQSDPQINSIRILDKRIKSSSFYDLIVLNALVSYRLRVKGEIYWDLFARSVGDGDVYETIIQFLKQHHALGINGKIRRLNSIQAAHFNVSQNMNVYMKDLSALVADLGHIMGIDGNSKTLIFAAKMFYYAVGVREKKWLPVGMELPMPVDSRILRITKELSLIPPTEHRVWKVQEVWGIVASVSGVPPLNLDSLLWPHKGDDIFEYIRMLATK